MGTNDEDEGEPVTEEDRLAIKTRLVDMGLSPEAPDRASLSEREQELLDMVGLLKILGVNSLISLERS